MAFLSLMDDGPHLGMWPVLGYLSTQGYSREKLTDNNFPQSRTGVILHLIWSQRSWAKTTLPRASPAWAATFRSQCRSLGAWVVDLQCLVASSKHCLRDTGLMFNIGNGPITALLQYTWSEVGGASRLCSERLTASKILIELQGKSWNTAGQSRAKLFCALFGSLMAIPCPPL